MKIRLIIIFLFSLSAVFSRETSLNKVNSIPEKKTGSDIIKDVPNPEEKYIIEIFTGLGIFTMNETYAIWGNHKSRKTENSLKKNFPAGVKLVHQSKYMGKALELGFQRFDFSGTTDKTTIDFFNIGFNLYFIYPLDSFNNQFLKNSAPYIGLSPMIAHSNVRINFLENSDIIKDSKFQGFAWSVSALVGYQYNLNQYFNLFIEFRRYLFFNSTHIESSASSSALIVSSEPVQNRTLTTKVVSDASDKIKSETISYKSKFAGSEIFIGAGFKF